MDIDLEDIIASLPGHVYWKDRDFVFVGSNINNWKEFGFRSLEEYIGKTDYDIFSKEEADQIRNTDEEVLRTGRPKVIEELITKANGEKILFLSHKIPLKNKKKQNIGLLGVSIDITSSKQASFDELDMLEKIIAIMPGTVYWMNKEGVYLGCNDNEAKVIGLSSRKDIVGKKNIDLAGFLIPEALDPVNKKIMETGEAITLEEPAKLADGTLGTFISSKVPIKNNRNDVVGMVGISIDITDRKKMEEELNQARITAETSSRSKSEFIANMSHDIRTPLTGIIGMAQEMFNEADELRSIIDKKSTGEKNEATLLKQIVGTVLEDSQLLIEATDELLQLLNEILETMRLDSGHNNEKIESFNLEGILKQNINLFQPTAIHKKLKLTYEIDPSIPVYYKGLRNYLDRTVLNLLSNALKFTEKGFVKITIQLLDNHSDFCFRFGETINLELRVEDSGIGIPKDKFETIFEHFSRLTPSYQGLYKGAGLGLYTVKRYIEAMQAKIKLESEVGKGTCFIVHLPLIVTDHSDREKTSFPEYKKAKELNLEKRSKSEKITKINPSASVLIVEDNRLAAKSLQACLNHLNCTADLAVNGRQALMMLENNNYDLILMDIGLPDIDGIAVTKEIRSMSRLASLPIIAVTGHANDPEKRKEALTAGMQEVCTKPMQSTILEALLEQFVYKRRKDPNFFEKESKNLISDTLAVIDKEDSLKKLNGDIDLFKELLLMLDIDLRRSQEILAKAYETHDVETLRKELHRVRGGIAYLTLPQLSSAFARFHEAVKSEPQDSSLLKLTNEQLQQALKVFWHTLNKGNF